MFCLGSWPAWFPAGEQSEFGSEGRVAGDFPRAVTYSDAFFLFSFQCVVLKTRTVCSCSCLGTGLGS